ncbi:chromate resistance protein [Geminicoccaceae bacterium 1502E]|nr:chromate resistance protein [Geminicoccaceae bacterium 1502E]
MPRSIVATTLHADLAGASPPLVLDVRRPFTYRAADSALPGALRRPPDTAEAWQRDLPPGRSAVVYCVHGHEVSQTVASVLDRLGTEAAFLEGGIEGWREAGLELAAKPAFSTLWVTRERPKIDRVACPWLIRRFVDAEARFLYVPPAEVLSVADRTGAVPYDVPGVAMSHEGERCSFDALVRHYGLEGTAMDRLAAIVRGADTDRFDLAPAAAGLFAISLGLSANIPEDPVMMEQGMMVYDALHTWCARLQGETHNWQPSA